MLFFLPTHCYKRVHRNRLEGWPCLGFRGCSMVLNTIIGRNNKLHHWCLIKAFKEPVRSKGWSQRWGGWLHKVFRCGPGRSEAQLAAALTGCLRDRSRWQGAEAWDQGRGGLWGCGCITLLCSFYPAPHIYCLGFNGLIYTTSSPSPDFYRDNYKDVHEYGCVILG